MSGTISQAPWEAALQDCRVLVTGHTGFTGGWLCEWLSALGADVAGLALKPETDPSLYDTLSLDQRIRSHIVDVRCFEDVARVIDEIQPELIVHLAAQPLVRKSYASPVATLATNVMGTAHLLEAARSTGCVRAFVSVTTDKVYANDGRGGGGYSEDDPLGAADPYSTSKAAAELVTACYRDVICNGGHLAVASVRAGNIIGGGDWSADRIVPDFVRAVVSGTELVLRFPDATRPWQHVLSAVHAYLLIGSTLLSDPDRARGAWNVGPQEERSVADLVAGLGAAWKRPKRRVEPSSLPEAALLALNSDRIRQRLGWHPLWEFEAAVGHTADWYGRYYSDRGDGRAATTDQIAEYRSRIGG